MSRFIPLLFALLCVPLAYGQTATVEGTVRDVAGGALPGVNVFLDGTTRGAATDTDGRYRIEGLEPGTYTLVASVVGFLRATEAITLAANSTAQVDFVLTETVLESGEVVVTAGRRAQLASTVAASISVLSPRDLEVRNVVGLDDALRYLPGVQLLGSQVNIRGSSGFAYNTGSRVLLLLDGVPLLTPDSDGVPFDVLPIQQIEQVEVLKGPGSALYGSGALGGVIQIVTKPFPAKPTTSVQAFAGVHEPSRYEEWTSRWPDGEAFRPYGGLGLAHARRFRNRSGMWINLTYRNDPGYVNLSTEESFYGYAKFGVQLNPTMHLGLLLGALVRNRDTYLFWNGADDALNPGNLSLTGDNGSPSGSNDDHINQLSVLPTFTHVVRSNLFYSIKGRLFGSLLRPIDDDGNLQPFSDGTVGFRYGGEAQVNWSPRPAHYLTAGLTGDKNATRSSFFVTSDGDDAGGQPERAVFAQWEQPLGPLNVVAGLRYDSYSIDTDDTVRKLSPKFSAALPLGERTTLRAAVGQGFRVPSFAERYTDDQNFFPIFRNLDLLPEQSTSFELGIKHLWPVRPMMGLSLDAAAFWNNYTDLIEPTFVRLTNPSRVGFQFLNLTEARIRGLDASLEGAWRGDRLTFRIAYTYLDADDTENDVTLSFRPRHLAKAATDIRLTRRFSAGLDYRYAQRPDAIDSDFSRFVPDADVLVDTRVLDVRLGVNVGPVRTTFLVKNALDYVHLLRPALLGPPRQFVLQVAADL